MLLMSLLVGSFGLLITTHVALTAGLVGRRPWWQVLLALLVPPLAPVWGVRHRLVWRTVLWLVSLLTYTSALLASLR